MNRRRRRKILLLVLALLAVFIGLPGWKVYRQYRQQRLNNALIAAAYTFDANNVKILLAQGADPNEQVVLVEPLTFEQTLRQMLEEMRGHHPAQEASLPILYATVFPYGTDNAPYSPEEAKQIDAVINVLVANGADVKTPTKQNAEVFCWVASLGSSATLKLFLEHGAQPNPRGPIDGSIYTAPPLLAAAFAGNVETVRLLLAHGANTKYFGEPDGKDYEAEDFYSLAHSQFVKNKAIRSLLEQAARSRMKR